MVRLSRLAPLQERIEAALARAGLTVADLRGATMRVTLPPLQGRLTHPQAPRSRLAPLKERIEAELAKTGKTVADLKGAKLRVTLPPSRKKTD